MTRFRRAYWQALRELDSIRLRQWEQHHLTLPQLRVVYQVRRTPGITVAELAPLLGVTVSTVSGLVGKLADRGIVERTTAADDRRQAPLRLTEAGATLIGELSQPARAFAARVAAALGDDLGGVTDALERLVAAAQEVARADAGRELAHAMGRARDTGRTRAS
ncbi:MAG TPA: MarR family transcriptional regulator [Thermomicrobiales bacterium]|nr:MarR family transcriptional regulator [Thermomicrobiales bacterium]